jgi:hypothetical protein
MPTRTDVTTASILVRGPLERVREAVVRLGREAWIAPAGEGWVLVLPDHPADGQAVDDVDPYDLVGLGRAICDSGLAQVLVFSVRRGLGVSQLMSREHDTAFIGWRSEESGEPAASRVEPDAFTFCSRFGVPERTELLELLLDDRSGTPEARLAAFCTALGLPVVAIGATADRLAQERLHLPAVERHRRRGRVERLLGRDFAPRPWPRRAWVLRGSHLLVLAGALAFSVEGWVHDGSWPLLALGLGAVLALTALGAEIAGELRRSSVRSVTRVPRDARSLLPPDGSR